MTLAGLAAVLETTGLPVTYLAWPEGKAPGLPYICYLTTGTEPTFADGGVYYAFDHVRVELYTQLKDPEEEVNVEAALKGFHWKKDSNYISTERCWKTDYDIEV